MTGFEAGQGAVVTGAAGGIGRAIAERLVAGGLRVVVNDLDDAATRRTADEIGAHAAPGDAASEEGVAALIEAATDHLGAVDVWCANAGIDDGHGLEAPEADWARAFDVNVMAHVRAARLLVPAWERTGGGRFVTTASAAGLLTMLEAPAYSVTKHGAVAFAEWLSATYRHRGVQVHAICPQGVRTAMLDGAGPLKDLLSRDRALEPAEVADALWSAVDEGRFLVLPHPEVADYYAARATRTDRWLDGMNHLQQGLEQLRADSADRPDSEETP